MRSPVSGPHCATAPSNQAIADRLVTVAELLQLQGANPFRVMAYRRAAETLAKLERPVAELVARRGREALVELPHIGQGIAGAIDELLRTGRWGLLDRLEGRVDPEDLLETVPGLGPELARRLHETLHVETLEALEVAAHDGRLEQVPGIGPGRAAAIRSYLAYRLGGVSHPSRRRLNKGPGVSVLLEVDREYRQGAAAGELPTVAPRRFNPKGSRWLPIGHFEHAGWHFTALFSNTARAHRLGRTKDWVVLYSYDDDHREGQYTVVTETRGDLAGLRVVRGREAECHDHYLTADSAWVHNREIDLDRARLDPALVFRNPKELAAHPDLSTEEKIDLLQRWHYDACELAVAEEEGMIDSGDSTQLSAILETLDSLTGGFDVEHSPPTKQGGLF